MAAIYSCKPLAVLVHPLSGGLLTTPFALCSAEPHPHLRPRATTPPPCGRLPFYSRQLAPRVLPFHGETQPPADTFCGAWQPAYIHPTVPQPPPLVYSPSSIKMPLGRTTGPKSERLPHRHGAHVTELGDRHGQVHSRFDGNRSVPTEPPVPRRHRHRAENSSQTHLDPTPRMRPCRDLGALGSRSVDRVPGAGGTVSPHT